MYIELFLFKLHVKYIVIFVWWFIYHGIYNQNFKKKFIHMADFYVIGGQHKFLGWEIRGLNIIKYIQILTEISNR